MPQGPVKTVGLIINPFKHGSLKLGAELATWLIARGIRTLVDEDSAAKIGQADKSAMLENACESDMLIVLGGDGTILRVARTAGSKGTPILGIHLGHYGFITEIHPPDAIPALERVLEGDYQISERMMLQARLIRSNEVVLDTPAFNDAVVSKGPLARLLKLQISVGENHIAKYAADGIIVSSPTGSTAYSLSAGGPVVNPNVKVMIITPICPHTLNARSLVIPDTESVQIIGECSTDESMMLTIDGQVGHEMKCIDKLDVRKADYTARIVYWNPMSFYNKLHSRLRWGERFST